MPSDRERASVAGIVLAAGASVRMGRNKLCFDVEGEPLVHRMVRRAIEAGLEPVIVVVGHEAARVQAALSDLACTTVVNPDYGRGINSSVRAGIEAVPTHAGAAVVLLADMPLVSPSMVEQVVARYRSGRARLVVSRYGDVNAPPTLYDRALFEELTAMDGEGCGKQVVSRHRDEADVVSWPPEALTDLDVPADYDRVKAFIEEGAPLHAQ